MGTSLVVVLLSARSRLAPHLPNELAAPDSLNGVVSLAPDGLIHLLLQRVDGVPVAAPQPETGTRHTTSPSSGTTRLPDLLMFIIIS